MKTKIKFITATITFFVICLLSNPSHAELVALWEFEYGTGYDSCGSNYGTINSKPDLVNGRFGRALKLDGIDDYIDCGNDASLNITDKITISTWVKTVNAGNGQDFPFIAKGDHCYAIKHHRENNIEFFTYDGYWHSALSPIDKTFNGNWHHLAGTYDGKELRLYIDGLLKVTAEHQGAIESREHNFNIGRNPERNRFFSGMIDDVCIFNNALTEREIEQLFNKGGASFLIKDSMTKLTEESEIAIKNLNPLETIEYLEKIIIDHQKRKVLNLESIRTRDSYLPSDIYYLLAKAKEATDAPEQDVIASYKKSISQPQQPSNYLPVALLWLSRKIPSSEYTEIVNKSINNSDDPHYQLCNIITYIESEDDWSSLNLILDALFKNINGTTEYAQTILKALEKNQEWTNKFMEYCRSKPECTGFIFHEQEKDAEKHIAQKDYKKAAEKYQNIIKQCTANQRKNIYELKLYECLFNDGQYDKVIETIDSFIKSNKTSDRALTIKAILLKGQVYVYMGNPEAAIDTFLRLIIEYPQSKQAQEANFIMGYCLMLQGNYQQATEAFNLLISDYPESSYAAQAESYLQRIKNMTE